MSVTIKKDQSSAEIEKKIKSITKKKDKKGLDVSRFFGKIQFGEDGLTYQKKIRDEWE